MMDLSRHNNADLAGKAKAIAEQFDIPAYVNQAIQSNAYQDLALFLLRIPPAQSRQIVDQAQFPEDSAVDKEYIEKIVFDGFIKQLFPTVLIPYR